MNKTKHNPLSKSLRKKIKKLDNLSRKLNNSVLKSKAKIDKQLDKIKTDLDSMNKMGKMGKLRLQMALDRRSKFMTELSNICKKTSDTDESLVQNMK